MITTASPRKRPFVMYSNPDITYRRGLLIVTYETLAAYRFGITAKQLAAELAEIVGQEHHWRTTYRNLLLLSYLGLARASVGGPRTQKWAITERAQSLRELGPIVALSFSVSYAESLERAKSAEVIAARKKLSDRQKAIMRLLAEGRSSAEIGNELSMSTNTVDTHRSRIRKRLGITSTDGLIRLALLLKGGAA